MKNKMFKRKKQDEARHKDELISELIDRSGAI